MYDNYSRLLYVYLYIDNERKLSQSDQICNRLPPPPPHLNGKVIEISEKEERDKKNTHPSSSKWGRNGRNGDLSTSNIGRGIVGIIGKGKSDALISKEKVRERESSSGSNIGRGRVGVQSGARTVAGTGTGTGAEGCVRGDRVRGQQKVQSDKARLRHQVKAPVTTIPSFNDGIIASSSSSSSSSSSRTKNTYNDDRFERNEIDQSDRRQSKSTPSMSIIEGKDDFIDDAYSLSVSTRGDDEEYRCDSNECGRDLKSSDNGTPIAVRYRIREGNGKGYDSNLSTLITQMGSGRYGNKADSTYKVKNMNDVNNRSMSTDHRHSNQRNIPSPRGLVSGEASNLEYSQYDDDDFEGSDGIDDEVEVEEAKEGEDDTYSDCDSDFRDCSVDDIKPNINDVNENGTSMGRSRGSPDSHCLSSNGSATLFGEQEHTLRRSLSLATALTKDVALASSLHREKERGGRRENDNNSKCSSDDTADEMWSNVWGSDSDSDSSYVGEIKPDDKENFDRSRSHQIKKGWQTSYLPQGEKIESDSDEDGGHYSYTDFEEDSSETIQVQDYS